MTRVIAISAFVALFAFTACSKKDDKKTSKKSDKKPTTNKPTTKQPAKTPTPKAAGTLASVVEAYDSIRLSLATDKADVSADATKLAAAATSAKVDATASKHLTAVGAAAGVLAKVGSSDIAAVRKSFGSLSHAMVDLLTALPAEAKTVHVFECPMAKHYKRWIQRDKKLHNPYMGKRMPRCGSEIAFNDAGKAKGMKHEGMKH